jgi:hypothetical protein
MNRIAQPTVHVSPQRITLGKLLKEHITPNTNVACIGAFRLPTSDPAPLYASFLTRAGEGKVSILDSQAGPFMNQLKRSTKRGRRTGTAKQTRIRLLKWLHKIKPTGDAGIGNPLEYRKTLMKYSKEHRLGLKRPAVHLADLRKTMLNHKEADVLVDFGTMYHAAKGNKINLYQPSVKRDDFIRKVLSEYSRTSSTSLIAYDDYPHGNHDAVASIARSLGGTVILRPVINEYRIPVKPGVAQVLQHGYPYDTVLEIHWPKQQEKSEQAQ